MSNLAINTRIKRPGGRAEQVRRKVTTAVLDTLRRGEFDFSYQQIAELSGVNKTTFYRRWPNRQDLLRDALGEHNARFKLPETQTWKAGIKALIHEMARFLSQPTEIAMNLALLNEPDLEANIVMMDQWRPIQEQVNQLVKNAQSKGELSSDIEASAVTLMLVSPLLFVTLLKRKRADNKTIQQLVRLGQQLETGKS